MYAIINYCVAAPSIIIILLYAIIIIIEFIDTFFTRPRHLSAFASVYDSVVFASTALSIYYDNILYVYIFFFYERREIERVKRLCYGDATFAVG